MKKVWFKAKNYGWGWQPARWQGWAVLAVYLATIAVLFRMIDADSHSGSDTLINFFPRLIILTGLLIWVCAITGERPGWRWAGKPSSAHRVLCWTALILVVFVALALLMKLVFMGIHR
jgi:hypothetical protein